MSLHSYFSCYPCFIKMNAKPSRMDDSSCRLNFDLGKKNEIHHYSLKEHLKISKIAFYNISRPNFAILLILSALFLAIVMDSFLLPRSKFSL